MWANGVERTACLTTVQYGLRCLRAKRSTYGTLRKVGQVLASSNAGNGEKSEGGPHCGIERRSQKILG
jgi:hypothetical protein